MRDQAKTKKQLVTELVELRDRCQALDKRVEEARHQGEARYRALVENAADIIVIAQDGKIVFFNERLSEITGYTGEELLSPSFIEFFHPEDRAASLDRYRRIMAGEAVDPEAEYRIIDRENRVHWMGFSSTQIDWEGRPAALTTIRDITDRKEAEKAFRESQENLQMMVASASGFAVYQLAYDPTDPFLARVTFASPSVQDLVGLSPTTNMGEMFSRIHPEDVTRVAAANQQSWDTGQTFDETFRYHHPVTGEWRWLQVIANGKIDPQKISSRCNGIIIDVTERQRAEEALQEAHNLLEARVRERTAELETANDRLQLEVAERRRAEEELRVSRENLKMVVEGSPLAMALVDEDGNLEILNEQLTQMLGYGPGDIPTIDHWWALAYPDEDYRQKVKEFHHRFLAEAVATGGATPSRTWKVATKDGSVADVQFYSRYLGGRTLYILVDVTDQRRADEKLRRSEQLYRLLAENASDVIWTLDPNLNFTFISPSVERLRGFTPEEVMSHPLHAALTPDSYEVVTRAITRALEQERRGIRNDEPVRFELEQPTKDGSAVWTEVIANPLRDEEGNLTGILGVSRDISERRQAEEKQRQSEERYRFLAENMADIIWTSDLNFKTTYVSPSVEKVLGFTPEQRQRQTLTEMITPESYRRVMGKLAEELDRDLEPVTDPDRSLTVEVQYYHRDGSVVWMENRIKALRNQAGAIVGMYGSARDITERRQAEEALRESEERYRCIVEMSPEAVMLTDLSGRILTTNAQLATMHGFADVDELRREKRSVLDLVAPSARVPLVLALKESIDSGRNHIGEYLFLSRDGTEFPVLFQASVLRDEQGAGRGFISLARDITDAKRAEAELKYREAILQAVQVASERFLRTGSLDEDSVQEILEKLGQATQVSRVHVFENHLAEDGAVLASLRFEWARPGVESLGDLGEVSLQEHGLGRWLDVLGRGEIIHGNVKDLPAEEREILSQQGTRSLVSVPVFVGRQWWGVIGFDQCGAERDWSRAELEALKAAGEMFGGLIQRQQAMKVIQESEEKYRLLVENVNEGVVILQDGMIRFCNSKILEMTGHSAEELMSRPWIEVIHPDDRPELLERNRKRYAREPQTPRYTYRGLRKDGSVRWDEGSAVLIEWDGRPAVLSLLTDITDRKAAEEALQKSEANYRSLFENSPVSLWDVDFSGAKSYLADMKDSGVTDLQAYFEAHPEAVTWCARQFRVVDLNQATLNMYGARTKEDIREAARTIFTPETWAAFIRALTALGQGERDFEIATVTRTLAGEKRNIVLRLVAPPGQEGLPDRILVSNTDVTNAKRAEEALRESELWFRRIFNSLEEAVLVINPDRVLTDVNEAAVRIFGYTPQELAGQSTALLHVDQGHYREFGQRINQIFDRGPAAEFEFEAKRKDGEVFPTEHTVSLLTDDQDSTMGIVSVVRDISERKKAEAERERLIGELQEAMANIKTLRGMIPICANCKKIRDDKGFWQQVEVYVRDHSEAEFSHGICPECMKKLYPDVPQP